MRPFYLLIAIILISLPVLFMWLANDRVQEFSQIHNKVASDSTKHIGDAITRFIQERRRLVKSFATLNNKSMQALLKNPSDDDLVENLNNDFLTVFPNFIAFTLTDRNGDLLIDDFDGLIGELCQQDLNHFVQSGSHFPRVHPNTESYHFDIMVEINESENVLFVSFNADLLGSIIQTAEFPGHQFMLTFAQKDRLLIEVTKSGSRQHIKDRNDFRLDQSEIDKILFQRKVENTGWTIVDLHVADLFSKYRNKIITNLGLIYGIFLIVLTGMTIFMRRQDKLKQFAEQQRHDFIGVVSHELRTPLTSIKGSLSLVSNGVTGEIPEKAKEMLSMALKNSDRLIELVNDLLDIQKIESGKISLTKTDLNLSNLIKQAITDIEAYGSNFSVNYQLLDLIPNTIIHADEGRMLQVMNNLLSNAAKYGKKHDTVDVSIISYRNKARISISDNGKGISIELQNNVFEKFSQGKAENKIVNSTGLGLHIVKQIIALHDGEINFYTSETGTTFYIDLPIKKTES